MPSAHTSTGARREWKCVWLQLGMLSAVKMEPTNQPACRALMCVFKYSSPILYSVLGDLSGPESSQKQLMTRDLTVWAEWVALKRNPLIPGRWQKLRMARAEGTGRSQPEEHMEPRVLGRVALCWRLLLLLGNCYTDIDRKPNQWQDSRFNVCRIWACILWTKESELPRGFLLKSWIWPFLESWHQLTVILNVKQKGGMVNEGLKLGWGDACCPQHGLYKKL